MEVLQIYAIIVTILLVIFFLITRSLSKHNDELSRQIKSNKAKYDGLVEKNNKVQSEVKEQELFLQRKIEENNRIKESLEQQKKEFVENQNKKEHEYQNKFYNLEKDAKWKIFNDSKLFLSSKAESYPWLAEKISDFLCIEGFNDYYEHQATNNKRKIERGWKLREYTQEIKELITENTVLKYQLQDLEDLFPDINERIDLNESILLENDDSLYLSKDEWNTLTDSEKNQLILDRYKEKHNKTKWEIGSNFEMSVGYSLEKKGYSVEYTGISKKLEDLGRDLIATNSEEILIIQCKYWSQQTVIRERHICQLFGTTEAYKAEHPNERRKIKAVFYCHNSLSDVAKEMAIKLGIEVFENEEMIDYPMIKCNVSEGIYHLPCDDNYWNMMTEKTKNKFKKVFTVLEAENLGCRRAFRWNKNQ